MNFIKILSIFVQQIWRTGSCADFIHAIIIITVISLMIKKKSYCIKTQINQQAPPV